MCLLETSVALQASSAVNTVRRMFSYPCERHSSAARTDKFEGIQLEGQTASHLQDALGAGSRRDLAIVARREGSGGVGETYQVEDIGGFAAELEHHSTLELNVAEKSHIDIPEPRSIESVAAYVAVRATGPDTPCHTGPISCEGCRIEPCTRYTVGGANPAAVRVKFGADTGNQVGAAIAGTVIVLVRARGHGKYPAAMQVGDRRDLPAVDHFLDDFVLAVEVVQVPCAGNRGVAANVGTHIAFFLPKPAANST